MCTAQTLCRPLKYTGKAYLALGIASAGVMGVLPVLCLIAWGALLEQGWEAGREVAGELAVMGAVAVLVGLLAVGAMHEVGRIVGREFRGKYCEMLLSKDITYCNKDSAETIAATLEAEGQLIETSAGKDILTFVESAVCSTTACYLACVHSPELCFLGLLIAFSSISAYSLIQGAYNRLVKKKKKAVQLANQLSQQAAKNLTTISALNGQRHLQNQYDSYLTTTTGLSSTSASLKGLQSGVVWGTSLVLLGAVTWAGKGLERLWGGPISQEDAVIVGGAMLLVVYWLQAGVDSCFSLLRALEIANSVFKSAPKPPIRSIGREKEAITGSIEFQNVHFAYPNSPEVLSGLSMSCAPGQALALLGPARSGKSTLLGLLQCFHTPSKGLVLIGQIPINTLEITQIRRTIGYVPQRPLLFDLTIQENIALDTNYSSDFDLREAARGAHLLEYVLKLREQFATNLTRTKLTDEQRVKVGIARALLRKPAILILDEAMSMLETSSQEAILTALKGKITVLSAGRKLTSANLFEKVYTIAEGKATERPISSLANVTSKPLPRASREVVREDCECAGLKEVYFPSLWCMGLWQTVGATLAMGAGVCFPLAGLVIGRMIQGKELSGWALALGALGLMLLAGAIWLYARLAGHLTQRIANYGFKALLHTELTYRDEHYSAVAAMSQSLVNDAEKVSSERTIRYGVVLFTLAALAVSVGVGFYYGCWVGLVVAVQVQVQGLGSYYESLARRSPGPPQPCSPILKQAISSITSVTACDLQPFILSQYTAELAATASSGWGSGRFFNSGFAVLCFTFAFSLIIGGNGNWFCCLTSGFVTAIGISAVAALYPSKLACLQAQRRISALATRYRAHFALQSDGIVLPPRGHIVFKHVNFSYLSRMILHSVSFHINPQEKVGIYGPSGAGKTTLSLLLARLYDPTAGIITADGVDLRLYNLSKIHDFVGIASHDSVLFAGTIEYNIRFGSTQSRESLQEVLILLQAAGLALDREIGRQAQQVSAVVRRKIGLARVMLRCPRVVVLDDITRDMEESSEKELLATLEVMLRSKSVIMMSQRLGPLDKCSRILTIEQGVVSGS